MRQPDFFFSSIFKTCLPLYVPHSAHTLCGIFSTWHCGHGERFNGLSFHWDLLCPPLDLEIFPFGAII